MLGGCAVPKLSWNAIKGKDPVWKRRLLKDVNTLIAYYQHVFVVGVQGPCVVSVVVNDGEYESTRTCDVILNHWGWIGRFDCRIANLFIL